MSSEKVHWADFQEVSFMRWVNDYISERGMKIDSLRTGLANGLVLINLMEIISDKKMPRYNKHPKISFQKLENLSIALKFIEEEVKLVNISAEDIAEGNIRIILGLVWSLILRWEICKGSSGTDDGVNDLLRWIQSKIPDYGITGFRKDWNDGRALNALVNALRPELCADHKEMDPADKAANCKRGIDVAEEKMGVDKLVLPEEMAHPKVDKLAMMTYLAQFRNLKPVTGASRVAAYGPGLREGIKDQEAPFVVEFPPGEGGDDTLRVRVEGPENDAEATVTRREGAGQEHLYDVKYLPTVPGTWKVHVTVGDEHIPGSIFTVTVLEKESLGGEGAVRVFYSTTSGSLKAKGDYTSLERLFEAKKIHLRRNFTCWQPMDLMAKEDRDAVFRVANCRTLPMVFIDDVFVGGFDEIRDLEEQGKLDQLLKTAEQMGDSLLTEEEHLQRLKGMDPSSFEKKD